MAQTVIPYGDPRAKKHWSGSLAVDVVRKSYFERRFVAADDNAVIQRKTELESDAGDRISFDLSVQLRSKPTYGDVRLEGKEENLRFFTDEVKLDQVRHAVSAGGKMSRKRSVHDLRRIGRNRLGDYFSKLIDEFFFVYLSGARGINADFIENTGWTGFAGNALEAPDAQHLMYGGNATSKSSVDATDKMTRDTIERAVVQAGMMQALDPDAAHMMPVTVEGSEHYVLVMSPYQAYDLRSDTNATAGGWLDVQKAAAAAEGRNSPVFKGGLGMINNVILHDHRNVIRFSDYGAGGNVAAARALFMGRQAGVVAFGSTSGLRFDWQEDSKDYNNEPTVASGFIAGIKKTRFNGRDFGVLSIDTASTAPA